MPTDHVRETPSDNRNEIPVQMGGDRAVINLTDNTITFYEPDGRLVKMDLGPSDVHVDQALANYAAGYQVADQGLICDEACPVVPVPKASDKYYTWDKDNVFQDVSEADLQKGNAGGTPAEISPALGNDTFVTIGRSLGAYISTEEIANADAPLAIEQTYIATILSKFKLAREKRVATLLLTSGNWTGGYTAAAAAKWNGGASSDPVADLHTAIESALTPVKAIALSERSFHDFQRNSAVQKYFAFKNSAAPLPGPQQMSAILDLPPFLVGRRKHKTGATSYGYVWGDNAALVFNEPGMPMGGKSISTAKTFRWTQADAGAPDGTVQGGFLVRSYFDPRRGARGGRVMVVACNEVEAMTSVYAGGLVTGVHA